MLINKSQSYEIKAHKSSASVNKVLADITSDRWFRSVSIIKTPDNKRHFIKFTTLGTICYLVARIIGQGSAFVKWSSNLQGKVECIKVATMALEIELKGWKEAEFMQKMYRPSGFI